MSGDTLERFVQSTEQRDARTDPFELENPYVLEVNLQGRIWTKVGAMIAHLGNVRFTREGILEHGLGRWLKRLLTGEGTALMKAEGCGRVYLADRGKKIRLLQLRNEIILTLQVRPGQPVFTDPNATVAWSGALSPALVSNITPGTLIGRGSGETFRLRFEGQGWVVLQPNEDVFHPSRRR